MKRLVLAVVVMALVAGVAAAVEPSKLSPTMALSAEHAKLPVSELKKLQPPPNARLTAQVVRQAARIVQPSSGPDLVPIAPTWTSPGYGPSLGFPAAQFNGWRANWGTKNVGSQVAQPPHWKIHFSCEVINVPPGSEQYEYFNHQWCSFSEGTFNMPMVLVPNAAVPAGLLKAFVGYPLWSCACPNCPKPRIKMTVDSESTVAEPGREGNNEYQIDVCLAN